MHVSLFYRIKYTHHCVCSACLWQIKVPFYCSILTDDRYFMGMIFPDTAPEERLHQTGMFQSCYGGGKQCELGLALN